MATSLHYGSAQGEYPLALRLYLPEKWTSAPERLEHARVPAGERAFKTKWEIALDLLDEVRAEGLPHGGVLADAGYGVVTEFRDGLDQRQEAYIVGLHGDEVVLIEPPLRATRLEGEARPAIDTSVSRRGRTAPSRDPHAGHVVGADDDLLARRSEGQPGGRRRLGPGLTSPPLGEWCTG